MNCVHITGIVLGALAATDASYCWSGTPSHDRVPDTNAVLAQHRLSPAEPLPRGEPTGHMPPWHHGLIHGTKADDVLNGTESGERIVALAGRDRIIARGGDDVLEGGADSDVLMGGPGNDTYVIGHHGDGADIILEEAGVDTIELAGGRIALASIEVLRHGDDVLIRWNHEQPADSVMIRSWFVGERYHVERLRLTDGTVVSLESLVARAKPATSEDIVHFPQS